MRAPPTGDAAALTPDQAAVADTGAKAMIPVAGGRPFLDYVISGLADAGFTEVCVIVGPEHGAMRDHYSSGEAPHRARVQFAIQSQPRGTADALLTTRDFAGDGPFVVVNADNYYPPDVLAELRRQPPPALPAFSREGLLRNGQVPPGRIAGYALLDVGDDGVLRHIVEKPDAAALRELGDAPVSMNCWLFTPVIFEACRRVAPSPRGELELPLAVQYAIDTMSMRFHVFRVDAPVLDLSERADIPGVVRRLEGVAVIL
jgi:glucose-1-phosphate thymidylyltransferase